jgi:hypothetical protein
MATSFLLALSYNEANPLALKKTYNLKNCSSHSTQRSLMFSALSCLPLSFQRKIRKTALCGEYNLIVRQIQEEP